VDTQNPKRTQLPKAPLNLNAVMIFVALANGVMFGVLAILSITDFVPTKTYTSIIFSVTAIANLIAVPFWLRRLLRAKKRSTTSG
jgi:hypothetical protein